MAATPRLWSKHKIPIGIARKQIETELAATRDGDLAAALGELMGFIQSAFESGAAEQPDAYGEEVGQDLDKVKESSLAGERAAKEALRRIAELDAEV